MKSGSRLVGRDDNTISFQNIQNILFFSSFVPRGSARKESLEIHDSLETQKLQLEEVKRLWRLPWGESRISRFVRRREFLWHTFLCRQREVRRKIGLKKKVLDPGS